MHDIVLVREVSLDVLRTLSKDFLTSTIKLHFLVPVLGLIGSVSLVSFLSDESYSGFPFTDSIEMTDY